MGFRARLAQLAQLKKSVSEPQAVGRTIKVQSGLANLSWQNLAAR
jgi:hypothetical protein